MEGSPGMPPQPEPQVEMQDPNSPSRFPSRERTPFDRRGTQILQRFDKETQGDAESGFSHAMNARMGRALHKGKEMGIAGPDMIAHATA